MSVSDSEERKYMNSDQKERHLKKLKIISVIFWCSEIRFQKIYARKYAVIPSDYPDIIDMVSEIHGKR